MQIGAIHISRMDRIKLTQIDLKSWAGEIILSLSEYTISKEIYCDDKEKTKHSEKRGLKESYQIL